MRTWRSSDAPVEQQARAAALGHLARLAAVVVRVEDEAALVHALEQDRPHRRPPVARGGGQRHRRRDRPRASRTCSNQRANCAKRIGVDCASRSAARRGIRGGCRRGHASSRCSVSWTPMLPVARSRRSRRRCATVAAVGERSEQQRLRQRLLDDALDQARHRPRAERAVEALGRQPRARRRRRARSSRPSAPPSPAARRSACRRRARSRRCRAR